MSLDYCFLQVQMSSTPLLEMNVAYHVQAMRFLPGPLASARCKWSIPLHDQLLQVNSGSPMLLPEAHGLGEQQYLQQEQGPLPFGASLSHQQ